MTPTLQTDHSSFMIIPVLSQLKWTRFIINPDDNNIAEFKCVCVRGCECERETLQVVSLKRNSSFILMSC